MVGALLLWFGWFGFNGGSALAFNSQVPRVLTNTLLAGVFGTVTVLAASLFAGGTPRVPTIINGVLAGLVAITASSLYVTSGSAVIIGAIGAMVMLAVTRLLLRLRIDDVVGAVPVHLGAGIWGTLAVALFSDRQQLGTGLEFGEQLVVQLQGIVACFLVAFCLVYVVLKFIDRYWPLRVTAKAEDIGLNISEHGASTDYIDFLQAIEEHARTGDITIPVPEEPFTEVGQIAKRYNRLLRALVSARTRTEAVVNSATDAIVVFASDGLSISSLNPATSRLFGYPEEALIGAPLEILLTLEDRGDDQSKSGLLQRLLPESGAIARCETVGQRSDGSTLPIEITLAESKTDAGSFFVGTLRDISDRRQAEEAQQQLHDNLENMVTERTQELLHEVVERQQAENMLRDSEALIRIVLDNLPTAICLKDIDGRYRLVNKPYEA
jgi:Amt family ammonium transporter